MVFSSLILVGLLFGLFRDRLPLCNRVWSWTWGIPLALFLEGLKMGASHHSLSLFVVAYFTSNSVFVSFIGRQWNPFISMCETHSEVYVGVWKNSWLCVYVRSLFISVCAYVKFIVSMCVYVWHHWCVWMCEITQKYMCMCSRSWCFMPIFCIHIFLLFFS